MLLVSGFVEVERFSSFATGELHASKESSSLNGAEVPICELWTSLPLLLMSSWGRFRDVAIPFLGGVDGCADEALAEPFKWGVLSEAPESAVDLTGESVAGFDELGTGGWASLVEAIWN